VYLLIRPAGWVWRPAGWRDLIQTICASGRWGARRREQWKKYQGRLDPKRLVFIDETWAKTNMTPIRGEAPRGEKLIAPFGRWRTLTFLAALCRDRIDAPCVLDAGLPRDREQTADIVAPGASDTWPALTSERWIEPSQTVQVARSITRRHFRLEALGPVGVDRHALDQAAISSAASRPNAPVSAASPTASPGERPKARWRPDHKSSVALARAASMAR